MRDALEGKQYVENYVQTLTHEIKSPLSAIQGAAELLREDMDAEQRQQFLSNIHSETDRIKGVVERLLLLSSLENTKVLQDKEAVEIYGLVREAVDSVRPVCEARKLSLSFEGEGEAYTEGERFLLGHALSNMFQNAIQFSPEGGEIRVQVSPGAGSVEIEVTDEGPGIPEYAKERVFERFYSLKRPDSGKKSSGLGLSLVNEVATLHGGSITLTNRPEGGAVAALKLPLRFSF